MVGHVIFPRNKFHFGFNFLFELQNISGTFTAVINIIAIALAPNARTSAIYYFIAALFILLACFDSFFALPLNVITSEDIYNCLDL